MVCRVLAVDLGATSARVAVVDLDHTPPVVEVLHRVAHHPVTAADGTLRWDWAALIDAVQTGLRRGIAGGPVASIGVDTWGVDYGLLDRAGELIAPPISYRDTRTAGWRDVAARIGSEHLYRTTGIQLMAINTVFQLAAHDRAELDRARQLLMLPELVIHALTGAVCGERTSAGTTAMVDLATGTWSPSIVSAIGLDPSILPTIAPACSEIGGWEGIPIHLVGGHDTASAVVAAGTGSVFVSSGTWMLVGAEMATANTSDAAWAANFSNEPGVLGGVRFLRNVVGLWLVERVLAGRPFVPSEIAASRGPVVDPADPRFAVDGDVASAVRSVAGLPQSAGLDQVVRCVIDSIAFAVADVVSQLSSFVAAPVAELHLVGGGTALAPLVTALGEACGLPVRVGPREATALGNALAQGIALGRFADLSDARAALSV